MSSMATMTGPVLNADVGQATLRLAAAATQL